MLTEVRQVQVGGRWMRASIDADVRDIERRIREGDATVGWLGDDTLELALAFPVDRKGRPIQDKNARPEFQVWGRDARGTKYIALKWPTADVSLLRKLAELDPRTHDRMAELIAAEAKREQDAADKAADQRREVIDKLHWAILKDMGHHAGGTRRLHSMSDIKDKT